MPADNIGPLDQLLRLFARLGIAFGDAATLFTDDLETLNALTLDILGHASLKVAATHLCKLFQRLGARGQRCERTVAHNVRCTSAGA